MTERQETFDDVAPYVRLVLAAAVYLKRDVPIDNAFAVADKFIAILRADIERS